MDEAIWRSRIQAGEPQPALVDEEVLRSAERHPHKPAVIDGRMGRSVTYGQLLDGSRRVAAGLSRHGVRRGDVVSLVAANGVDYAVALYGALAAGAAAASANPALTASELAWQFEKVRPRVVFSDADSRAAVQEALSIAGGGAAVCALDDGSADLSMTGLLAEPRGRAAPRDPQDLAFLFPSSGTTGLPKLAAHSHLSATAFLQAFAEAPSLRVLPTDVVGVAYPFTHLSGTAVLNHSLRAGATVVTVGGPGFDLEAFLRMLQDHAATVATVTPPVILALARHPLVDRFDLSSLRLVMTSAAPCPPERQDEVEARLGCRVVDVLGSTEAWAYTPPALPAVRGSVGIVGAFMEAVIVDIETGARLGPDLPGELWIRGPQTMRGYVGDEQATAAALDPEGWLHTGDLCSFDTDGNLRVIDRMKELIKVGGYSVAPAEVERALVGHPAVTDAAVVGRPDPELGEVPVGYVSLSRPVETAELLGWLEGRLAPWKHLRDVRVVERVPRNPTGKVLRRELIARERGQVPASSPAAATSRASSARRDTPSFSNVVER